MTRKKVILAILQRSAIWQRAQFCLGLSSCVSSVALRCAPWSSHWWPVGRVAFPHPPSPRHSRPHVWPHRSRHCQRQHRDLRKTSAFHSP